MTGKAPGPSARTGTSGVQRLPLSGLRMLDLTNVLAELFACHPLAHLGDEVIKVEAPDGGDLARQLGADPALNRLRLGASFLAQNEGKRSIELGLEKHAGKAVLRRLLAGADAPVESFRSGGMQRSGLGDEALPHHNPRLVCCAICGYGQDGPLRDLPAYDRIIQGLEAVMSITGDAHGAPMRAGLPVADTMGSLTAALAVCAALAERDLEGGRFIDVSMLESVIATMGWAVSSLLVAGQAPQPIGNENAIASPSGASRTDDGLLNIAANKQQQFEALASLIGGDDPLIALRFAQRQARLEHRFELEAEIEAALAAHPAAHGRSLLTAAGASVGPVQSELQALEHPQVAGRGLVPTFSPGAGRGPRHPRAAHRRQARRRARGSVAAPTEPGPAHRPDPERTRLYRCRDRCHAGRGRHRPGDRVNRTSTPAG